MPAKRFTSVWSREGAQRAAPAREQPALSRDQIVRAAIDLLDAEGLDALSMRKLGARLGAGATSLYWHVAHKDELLELVLDEVYSEVLVPGPEAAAGWQDTVAAFAYGLREAILRHPWSVALVGVMPSIGPNALTAAGRLTQAMENAGFTGLTLDYAVSAVLAYTLGATTPEAGWVTTVGRSSGDAEEWMTNMRDQLKVAAADHPEMLARFDGYLCLDLDRTRHLAFDYGLSALLDGLRHRLHQPDAPAGQAARPGPRTPDAA
ncbi:TetR family transcriptional regulator [Sphaerisporangium melleum]|uniref:TetR family transcriptional regulator n=1 Tax=Sphaerisporangium melleum TaxID=321316 RepID=A0A917R1B0_9ACTN|nr:TetR/AcrR family transcriptional regulator C-terminal domain-containing protein [Sphaerisporangium melleum]GGK84062.1 TetR family transcriptional regulator [Sphaerisporangium melleum]GII69344.1 TetR family transcriptional regulator [Sphaerisporangium melleum]